MTLFEARSLGCRRGGRTVFLDLSFALDAGDALVLVGPNGSGKSTLLRLLALLVPRMGGFLLWQGFDVAADADAHRARLRYVGHQDAAKPVLSVRENLQAAAGLAAPGLGAQEINSALQAVDLAALADRPVRFLSAGQRRRLALARLVAAPAPLWLLDEPASGLDHASIDRLRGMIEHHRGNGGIVVASAHGELDLPRAGRLDLGRASLAA